MVTVKLVALVPVPAALVIAIDPEVALLGTVARIWPSESKTKLAVAPLKVTLLTPVKWLPLIVTAVPILPLLGVNELIVGASTRLKTKSST